MFRTIGRAVAAVVLSLAIAGCSDDGMRDGSMTMMLTDAPGEVSKAVVTIDEIYLQGGDDTTEAGGRVTLRSEPYTVDLVSLQNDVDSLFANVLVPGGNYSQLRFVISGAYIEVEQAGGGVKVYATSPDYAGLPAGTTVDGELKTPSFSTSGLKVTVPGSILRVDGDNTVILVDFDVSQSFGHSAGDSWVMHPVIKGVEVTATGGVQGTVTIDAGVTLPDTIALPGIGIQLGGETHPLLLIGGTASYSFANVLPGSYELKLVALGGAVAFTTVPVTPLNVNVGGGVVTTVDLTVTGVN